MIVVSRTSDALIEKAKECYVLGLISAYRLEYVTNLALTQPGYDAILDLPLTFELDDARRLERKAKR